MTTVMEVRPTAGASEVAALLRACSPESLASRFTLGGRPDPGEIYRRYLRYLLAGPPDGVALLARLDDHPVGLLNLVEDGLRRAEIGVLVADPWQRRGIGRGLTAWLWRSGRWAGWTVHATVRLGNDSAMALLSGQGFRPLPVVDRGERDFELVAPSTMTCVMKEAPDGEDTARADGVQCRAAGPDAGRQRDGDAGRRRACRSAARLPAALLPGR
ncbi:MAG TPA: GNAT family N-acetyltransferase [Amycolatopsis sp.]|nr:GNAT family N-acetyltransferase [Amycolatopsis sp.]